MTRKASTQNKEYF